MVEVFSNFIKGIIFIAFIDCSDTGLITQIIASVKGFLFLKLFLFFFSKFWNPVDGFFLRIVLLQELFASIDIIKARINEFEIFNSH